MNGTPGIIDADQKRRQVLRRVLNDVFTSRESMMLLRGVMFRQIDNLTTEELDRLASDLQEAFSG